MCVNVGLNVCFLPESVFIAGVRVIVWNVCYTQDSLLLLIDVRALWLSVCS